MMAITLTKLSDGLCHCKHAKELTTFFATNLYENSLKIQLRSIILSIVWYSCEENMFAMNRKSFLRTSKKLVHDPTSLRFTLFI